MVDWIRKPKPLTEEEVEAMAEAGAIRVSPKVSQVVRVRLVLTLSFSAISARFRRPRQSVLST